MLTHDDMIYKSHIYKSDHSRRNYMFDLNNPLCLGIEESEYKEMQSLGGMRQKTF